MRTILITGQGGSGRTTVAAATAVEAAREGVRTLVLSADRVDSLGAVLGVATGTEPVRVVPNLTAWRPDAAERFREDLVAFQERAASVLGMLGVGRLDAEELTPLPGAEELALLRALRDAALSEAYDLLVVDLPPAPQALALLGLPEELRRYLRRLLPAERQAARALRPVLGRLAGVPMPAEWLYETAARWDVELAAVAAVVEDPGTSVRLVAEPGPAGADLVRLASVGLALRALPVDMLIANRVLPEGVHDTWLMRPRRPTAQGVGGMAGGPPRSERPVPYAASPTWAATPAAATTSPPSTSPVRVTLPPASSGPSPTTSATRACSCGTSRCPGRYGTTWISSGAATSWSSRRGSSAVSFRCRRHCAAARSTAPPCAKAA